MTDSTPLNLNKPDAGSRHAGDMLREAREAQGLSIDHLSVQIKVAVAKLEALEAGQYERLGDANFTRALAMTVCRTLRIPHDQILAALPAARLHALGKDKPAINEPFKDHTQIPQLFDRSHRVNWRAILTTQWLAPIGILLLAAVIYAWPEDVTWSTLTGNHQPENVTEVDAEVTEPIILPPFVAPDSQASLESDPLEMGQPATALPESTASAVPLPPVASAVTLPASPMPQASAVAAPVAVPQAPVMAASLPAAVLAPAAPVVALSGVGIQVSEATWLEITDATGKKLLSRLAIKGEVLSLNAQPPIKVRIGNVNGVQLSYKGQPVSLAEFTRSNTARVELK